MSENIKIVRIFIGSPGGLEEERRAAREVIEEINQAHSDHWGCQFKLVGWEDTIPGYQRPQSLINVDLDKCQYFIGVLWNRWGTKPDIDDSQFTSGFEEEFSRARDLNNSGSMKDIALYFKEVHVPEGLEPGSEIKRVKTFRTQCIEEKRIFFKDFTQSAEFRDLVRSKITEIGWREFKARTSPDVDNGDAEQSPPKSTNEKLPADTKIFDQEILDFVSTMCSRTREGEHTSPYEVARFRLIASSLQRSGNDDLYLGNHDANLLFRYRKDITFSVQETRALADCGIVGFHNQNVPLWRWLIAIGAKSDPFERVKVLAVLGNTDERKNAIKLLQILGETVPDVDEFLSRELTLKIWLDSEENDQLFNVAAQFLSYNGTRTDIDIIDKISGDFTPDKMAKLDAVVAAINTRYSNKEALDFICAKGVEKIPETFIEAIFSVPTTLPTTVLTKCIDAKSDGVRLRAVKLLIERGELVEAEANNLLSDSNHQIRLMAVECLQKGSNALDADTVKTVLTIKKGSRGIGFFQAAETDATYYDLYLKNRLQELDFNQLIEAVSKAGVFNHQELIVLYGKFSKRLSNEIRANLRTKFEVMFEETLKKSEIFSTSKEELRAQVYRMWNFYQKKLCSDALAVLCGLKASFDIDLVRATLDGMEIELSPELLAYLAKFGDWSDLVRIERLATPGSQKRGLLDFSYDIFADEKAFAIYELGKSRIVDLLNMELAAPIRKSLAKIFPKSVFKNLSNDTIINELDRNDDEYRIIFSLRCVESLPKDRIETILDLYVDRDSQRYYNCIHWLDLGVSLPKKQANDIVRREMARRLQ